MDLDDDVALQLALASYLESCGEASAYGVDDIWMQDASAASLKGGPSDAQKPTSSATDGLPEFLALQAIHPDGWCFYDAVLKHLRVSAVDGEVDPDRMNAAMVAALCLSCLAQWT